MNESNHVGGVSVTVHALERYVERVMGLGAGMRFRSEQMAALTERIVSEIEARIAGWMGDVILYTAEAGYVIKNRTVVTILDPRDRGLHDQHCGITKSGVKRYKKLRRYQEERGGVV